MTKTMRVHPIDEHRTRLLAAVHREPTADFYHRVLDFWVENNQAEANEVFQRVQNAVLSNDREQLRAVFAEGVDAQVEDDMRYLESVGRG